MKYVLISALLIISLLVPVALTSCAGTGDEKDDMTLANSDIPLIDTAVHAKVETATFALG